MGQVEELEGRVGGAQGTGWGPKGAMKGGESGSEGAGGKSPVQQARSRALSSKLRRLWFLMGLSEVSH